MGRERAGLGVWGWWMQTIAFRMDKQQGPTASTGNCIQSPGINHNGKEYLKRMCMCVKLSPFAAQQRLPQHCTSTILQYKNNINFLFLRYELSNLL